MEENNNDYLLSLKNISKVFPGVKALDSVNLNIRRGEIHALIGENGAGKSTLMKVLSGLYPVGTYDGEIWFDGEKVAFSTVRESENSGIQIIYQELALCKYLSIAENIYLGNERSNKYGLINANETLLQSRKYLEKVGLNVDPGTMVISLGIGQQQQVEIAKAISKRAKLLILDEPTASLTDAETENLFNIMRQLKAEGVTCIIISHRLNEVFEIADAVTVLRDGQVVSTDPVKEMTTEKMIMNMVGRDMSNVYPRVHHKQGEKVLEVKNWSVFSPEVRSHKLVDDASFSIYKGEVLGISGLIGAGRTELALSIFGCYKGFTKGELLLDGKKITINNPSESIAHGIAYLTEDRKRYGLVLDMNLQDNIALASLEKMSHWNIVNNGVKCISADKMISDMRIKTPSSEQLAGNLSGGNQQKVVIGKWLLTSPRILIMDEPTRGIDVGAKWEIYNIINKLVDEGVCVVMISSDLPEILGMSDRIMVLSEGKLTAILDNSKQEITQDNVMKYCVRSVDDEQ